MAPQAAMLSAGNLGGRDERREFFVAHNVFIVVYRIL